MPNSFEFPRMLRSVVPLVRGERRAAGPRVVYEFIALGLGHSVGRGRWLAGWRAGLMPGFPAVIGSLNNLTEPTARLGNINPIGIGRRSLHVIDFPAAEMRAGHIPFFARRIRTQ